MLGGCASTPTPPAPEESLQQVAERWGSKFRVRWQLLHEGRAFALGGTLTDEWTDHLVFVDGRLACTATEDISGTDWYWVSQPDGLAYLAGRLENACGRGDPVPARALRDAVAEAPAMPATIAEAPGREVDENSVAHGVGTVLITTLVVGVGMILSPLLIGATPVVMAYDSAVEADRAKVTLAMPWAEAVPIVGEPSVSFRLPAADTDVHSYLNYAATDWHVGVRDGRVIWIAGHDEWLDAVARQTSTAAK
jgi:hypothetical protein